MRKKGLLPNETKVIYGSEIHFVVLTWCFLICSSFVGFKFYKKCWISYWWNFFETLILSLRKMKVTKCFRKEKELRKSNFKIQKEKSLGARWCKFTQPTSCSRHHVNTWNQLQHFWKSRLQPTSRFESKIHINLVVGREWTGPYEFESV